MSKINVSNLTFCYDGSYDNIFEEVSFQLDTNWKLGFVARNGMGKTTLLNLLLGKYEYRGEISAVVEFDYFPYKVKNAGKTAVEVVEEIYPAYEYWQLSRELNYLEFDQEGLYRPFCSLSYGEQTKVLLAILFIRENHFLLIDEPTNHLDMRTREIISHYLQRKSGFILVSHDRGFLDGCIDHVLAINKSNITVTKGNFSSWWESKERQDAWELAENERLKKDIGRLETAVRQSGGWADKVESTKIGRKPFIQETHIGTRAFIGEKSRKMQMRRKNLERRQQKVVEEKSGLLKNLERVDDLKIIPLRHYRDVILEARDFALSYESKDIFRNLNLKLCTGERVAICGRNGCGKSSLLKKIMGEDIQTEGGFYMASGLKISYISQNAEWLKGNLSKFAEENNLDETLFKAILRKLSFTRIQFEKDMEQYSAGQKKKVLIAKSLCEQAHLYIWDEPLNYIDVFSRMQIEKLIQEFQPTMLLVEHDAVFLEKIHANIIKLMK